MIWDLGLSGPESGWLRMDAVLSYWLEHALFVLSIIDISGCRCCGAQGILQRETRYHHVCPWQTWSTLWRLAMKNHCIVLRLHSDIVTRGTARRYLIESNPRISSPFNALKNVDKYASRHHVAEDLDISREAEHDGKKDDRLGAFEKGWNHVQTSKLLFRLSAFYTVFRYQHRVECVFEWRLTIHTLPAFSIRAEI